MKHAYFGSSYDCVKHALLRWAAPDEPWIALPMFTEPFGHAEVAMYERLVGARVLNAELVPE